MAASRRRATAVSSFDAFVADRSPALLRSAWFLTGDSYDAENLVQGALAKIWPRWERIAGQGQPEAYVRQVMYTMHISSWRRRQPERPKYLEAPAHEFESAALVRHVVQSALETLPARQRAVIVLRFLEDQSEVQTAEVLGIGVGSVKSHTSRALKALRKSRSLVNLLEEE